MDSIRFLISLLVFSKDGEKILNQSIQQLKEYASIIKVSSIYQVHGKHSSTSKLHDLFTMNNFSGLSICLLGSTSLSSKDLLESLLKMEIELKEPGQIRTVSLNLLSYGVETLMTPSITLPFPQWHLRPELMVPSAEVWPEYVHPILHKSLKDLSKEHGLAGWGEFYAQVKSGLDF